jgi:thiol-disulfide isomerase/thioredoxin
MGRGVALLLVLCVAATAALSGCISRQTEPKDNQSWESPAWLDIELRDVTTNQTFKLSDFEGRPVLLESFAVWCSTCLKQQRETKEFKDRTGDAVVHVSLDTDPNEDEDLIREHVDRHGFDWLYAVSPRELTEALIDEFGNGVVNAPGAPVILICEDQSVRFLRRGVKSADDLAAEIDEGC